MIKKSSVWQQIVLRKTSGYTAGECGNISDLYQVLRKPQRCLTSEQGNDASSHLQILLRSTRFICLVALCLTLTPSSHEPHRVTHHGSQQ